MTHPTEATAFTKVLATSPYLNLPRRILEHVQEAREACAVRSVPRLLKETGDRYVETTY